MKVIRVLRNIFVPSTPEAPQTYKYVKALKGEIRVVHDDFKSKFEDDFEVLTSFDEVLKKKRGRPKKEKKVKVQKDREQDADKQIEETILEEN